MPSLFSRARTTSSPLKAQRQSTDLLDEFGRVPSRANGTAVPPTKKDKNVEKTRTRTLSAAKGRAPGPLLHEEDSLIPDGSFFPLNLNLDLSGGAGDPAATGHPPESERGHREREQDYGYLSYQHNVVLGLEEVNRLVRTLTDELGTRGLTTPFLFSSLALDISSSRVRRLIQSFLRTCVSFPAPDAEYTWREEARFAAPPELAICLRWGLARVLRVSGGNAVHGLISWDMYVEWSESELFQDYPATHFEHLIAPLQQPLPSIIFNVLSLLARLTAHSSSSGHTPPTLSPLFGPLIFGLGPASLPFHHTYLQYLRVTHAMEHVILAFVRWQDAPSNESSSTFGGGPGSAASLGVPTRLKDWIRGYPAMLPEPSTRSRKQERLQPRRGARTVRVVSVRRNVRMYTPDLVKSAASWASRPPSGVTHAPNAFAQSRDWERLAPRYADSYKKRMDLPSNFHPHPGIASSSASISSSTTISTLGDSPTEYFGTVAGEERFRSLTDLKWGEFEAMGFGGLETGEKKLQFDLTESARTSRAAKRTTLTWTDFSSTGFSRMDAPLSTTLQFSSPLINSISAWPEQQTDITRKVKKLQKSLPPFGWDTEPVMGAEVVIEESFVDVFCDLIYGGGWINIGREEIDRECNWALVEFKSLPMSRSTISGSTDPRTSSTVFLFEEFVPLEYRQQLSAGVQSKRTITSFFSPGKSKQWKQAPTLNGRPYVVGHVPRGLNHREAEFEGLLQGDNSSTKVISLGRDGPVKREVTHSESFAPSLTRRTRAEDISSPLFVGPRDDTTPRASTPAIPPPVPPSRLHYSDDELNSSNTNSRKMSKEERRRSKDDAWVDILVASHSRRAGNQDAEHRRAPGDPEMASLEVAQVLAGVRGPSPALDGESVDIEPMNVPHRSKIDSRGLDLIEPVEVPGVELAPPRSQRRMGYFDLHPERRRLRAGGGGEEDIFDEFARAADGEEDDPPRRSDVTESVYSEGATPPASPRPPVHRLQPQNERLSPVAFPSSSSHASPQPSPSVPTPTQAPALSLIPVPVPAPSTQAPSPRDLQRQQEVRDRLSGKPGPKASSLIEMYREKERQASGGSGNSPGKSSNAAAIDDRGKGIDASTPPPPSPPAPPSSELAFSPVDTPVMEPPNLDFDHGRESPYRYVHGAPLHNVVEEEEEE
ncbi:hypothetical protein BGY98DRAFT_1108804 [Russula aff. rugulosa BPL654]|nr:hypothetical protein BGY98DRAFT_1108804 [Russula aff. rugulosa BPL654]